MKLKELLAPLDVRELHADPELDITGISYDSRTTQPGELFVVGGSSSEMVGARIGKGSSLEAAQAAFAGIYPVLQAQGIELAVQCCEHLNRALVVERAVAESHGFEIVNAIPQLHAGGSFAMTAWANFKDPVLVETIVADAGIDIGGTLIGMHLRRAEGGHAQRADGMLGEKGDHLRYGFIGRARGQGVGVQDAAIRIRNAQHHFGAARFQCAV